MKLDGRRESTNVEDRRGNGGKVAGGLGIGGILVVGVIALLLGLNPTKVLQQFGSQEVTTQREISAEREEEYKTFALQILASTEDVWNDVFKQMGKTYEAPKLVLYKDRVGSGCGNATSSVGPFYCPADQCIYLDLNFFDELDKQMGASGDFACAYVIAHECGHHVQHLLGTLDQAHAEMKQLNDETEANKISVRIELQADYYAGVWGYYENKTFGSLEPGDMEEAINAAQKIGDDYLQRQATGNTFPEKFTHGTSAQRVKWLRKGLTTGNMRGADTFSQDYNAL